MPLMRYFVFVGGALLALLWIVSACLPAVPVAQASRSSATADLSVIRIRSDRKWPERVVFDTTQAITSAPAPAAAPVVAAVEPPARAVTPPLKAEVREAFAQATPVRAEPKRKRKSVARNYAGPPRIRAAQQPPSFFYGNNLW